MKIGSTLLLALLSSVALANESVTPTDVIDMIKSKGTDAALRSLYQDESRWLELLRGIATGKTQWLAVATKLRPASDAGASEQLALAVGEALANRAGNVLSIAVPGFTISSVCSGPDVDDKRFDSYRLAMAAIEKRERRVRAVKNERLAAIRDRCLTELEQAKLGVASFYAPPK